VQQQVGVVAALLVSIKRHTEHRSNKKTSYKTATIGSTHNKDRALRLMALTRRLTNAKEGTKTSGGECVNSFFKNGGRRKKEELDLVRSYLYHL
tara:strand:+ start:200 stop:481 length:282 start_codon:yes stop_codon:yes gene_type:complete